MARPSFRPRAAYSALTTFLAVIISAACTLDITDAGLPGDDDNPEPRPPLIINLSPTNYQVDQLVEAGTYYIDRDYTIVGIPSQFQNWLLIKTANDDKVASNDTFIAFDLTDTATVAIAYDKRASSLPSCRSTDLQRP